MTQIKQLLQVEQLHLIPAQPYNMTGHAGGMVRFLDDHILLVADYSGELNYWKNRYRYALQNTGLRLIDFPAVNTNIKNSNGSYSAIGRNINFAWIGDVILFPRFDLPQDKEALKDAKHFFKNFNVIPVPAAVLAEDVGVLICTTWNVQV